MKGQRLTLAEAEAIRLLLEKEEIFLNGLRKEKGLKPNSGLCLDAKDQKDLIDFLGCELTNEMRSDYEVLVLRTHTPEKYFAYMDEKTGKITNWMGEIIGSYEVTNIVKHYGFISNKKIYFRAKLINGASYWGFGFGEGTYCRLYLLKNQVVS